MLVNLFWLFFENASLETFTYLSFFIILFLLFGTEAAMLMPIRILYVFVFVGYPFNFMHFNVFGFCLKNIFFEDVNVSSILEECICKQYSYSLDHIIATHYDSNQELHKVRYGVMRLSFIANISSPVSRLNISYGCTLFKMQTYSLHIVSTCTLYIFLCFFVGFHFTFGVVLLMHFTCPSSKVFDVISISF